MSMRTQMVSISSLDPIRSAIGCNDDALVAAVMERFVQGLTKSYGEEPDAGEVNGFRECVESMLKCDPAPAQEPGCWDHVIEVLAAHFGLQPKQLPLDLWKHLHVWDDYQKIIDSKISAEAKQSLMHLKEGRALRGDGIDPDGCLFSWLTSEEVAELRQELKPLPLDELREGELDGFHQELLECLRIVNRKRSVLFLTAH